MDRATAKLIRSEVEEAITKIANKHKLTLDLGAGSFTSADFSVRVKMVGSDVLKLSGTTTHSKTSMSTKGISTMFGLPADIIGSKFKQKTKTFEVVGFNPSRPKNSVSLKDQNGKLFKCSLDQLRSMMN